MAKIVIDIPKELEDEKVEIEEKLREIVELEVKKKKISKFFDNLMQGAKQLDENEIVEFSKKFKKAGAEELNLV